MIKRKVVRVNDKEFELENGQVFQHNYEKAFSVNEFQVIFDSWQNIIATSENFEAVELLKKKNTIVLDHLDKKGVWGVVHVICGDKQYWYQLVCNTIHDFCKRIAELHPEIMKSLNTLIYIWEDIDIRKHYVFAWRYGTSIGWQRSDERYVYIPDPIV